MPDTSEMGYGRARLGRVAAAAVLAFGLFASSPYTHEARAITDSAPNAVNARLVFSPALIELINGQRLCVRNYSNNDVGVIFLFQTLNGTIVHQAPVTIPANGAYCDTPSEAELTGSGQLTAQLIFTSPAQCSQATEYPGKCRMIASWEIFDQAGVEGSTRVHIEPVLLPGIPAIPRINPVPLPQ